MAASRWAIVCAGMLLAGGQLFPAWIEARQAGQAAPQAPADDNAVPSDLKSLLAAPESELRIVTQRYAIDRSTLNGNYDGGRSGGRGGRGNPGGGGGGGTDGRAGRGTDPATTPTPLSLSPNRIARLKRYDASWQAALARIDANKLSAAAKADLETLKATIQSNLAELDADATKIAQVMPLVPFAPAIIKLNETRIRLEDVKSQEAAGILTDLTRDIAKIKSRVEAGLTGATTPDAMKVSKDLATRGADAVDGLRNSVTTWFNFYNTYDPLFTWWMGMPYKQVDTALGDYAGFLRDKVAPADLITTPAPLAALAPGTVPAIKNNEVPDLQEIIALPQDEMRAIVQRFVGVSGGRGGRGATSSPGSGRPRQFYLDWMAALKTLDFDALSRNGQVDYLFIKNACERQIARLDFVPEANPPRKTDSSGIPGAARGRAGLDHGSRGRDDSVLAGAAHRPRQQGIRVAGRGDEEGVAADGIWRRLETRGREGEGHVRPTRSAAGRGSRHAVRSG